jgi:glycosyltransferase involved in cell wall biosynthesis
MSIHVCIDARLFQATGIGTLLKAALTSLRESQRFKLTLLGLKKDIEQLSFFGCDLVEMDIPIYTVKEQIFYPQKIPTCDLFWSPHFNVPLLPIKAKKRVVTVCDVYHLAYFSTLSLSQKVYAKIMYNAAFYLSDLVTTISEFSKEQIGRFATLKPGPITVVSPGFDHFKTTVTQSKREHLLFVGNLKPHKNIARLLHAYALLAPPEPLLLVGALDKGGDLINIVEKSSFLKQNVHFLGTVSTDQLHELYQSSKVFLFPSLYEGFGYPPLEAMAFGCPVVAAQAGSIPEVCQDAVQYVDPLSIESIAEGIAYVLNNEKRSEELSRKGKELFEKKRGQKNLIGDVFDACCHSS